MGNKIPRISIVTPSYNQAQFLEETIQSILSQDYPSLEYILIDGGSTDGSLEIIQKYRDRLAYWVSEPDRGQSHAINKGFARCTGEIVTFLSSDDYYLPGTLMDVAESYRQHPGVGAVIGGFCFLDTVSGEIKETQKPFLDGGSPVDLSLGPPGKYCLHQVSTFYTRAALEAVGRYVREDFKYVMDRELLYRVCRSYPIVLADKTYSVFRKHPQSKSVASVLPFAREFADMYLSFLSGDPGQDAERQKMARYRLARGYIKFAWSSERWGTACKALIKAAVTNPRLIGQKSYFWYWLQILGFHKRQVELISE